MSKLSKFKLKKNLTEEMKKEDTGGKDTRFLPYYNMKEGEKVKVLIVPDVNGNLWKKYETHGPNLGLRGVKPLLCRYKHGGGDCPICQKAFDLLDQSKAIGADTSKGKEVKEEAKRWFPKSTTVMSVIVLDAPFDYPASPDHNEVKLMYVPYAVEALIKNSLAEGQIDEDSLTSVPLYIKKTKNKGGQASYENSYFDRSVVSDEEMAVFDDEDLVVEQFDFDVLDIIPEVPELDVAEEWLSSAEKADNKAKAAAGKGGSDEDDDTPKAKAPTSLQDRMKAKKAAALTAANAEQEEEEAEEQEEAEEVQEETPAPAPSRTASLRERLAAQRK